MERRVVRFIHRASAERYRARISFILAITPKNFGHGAIRAVIQQHQRRDRGTGEH
jgi:hypothetical protein